MQQVTVTSPPFRHKSLHVHCISKLFPRSLTSEQITSTCFFLLTHQRANHKYRAKGTVHSRSMSSILCLSSVASLSSSVRDILSSANSASKSLSRCCTLCIAINLRKQLQISVSSQSISFRDILSPANSAAKIALSLFGFPHRTAV